MTECIAMSNQKGGVGKSTTANALGAGLFRRGKRVLYIDLDAQGNLSYSLGVGNDASFTCFDVLTGKATLEEAVVHTPQGDLIPFSPALSKVDTVLTETGKEYRLQEALRSEAKGGCFASVSPDRHNFAALADSSDNEVRSSGSEEFPSGAEYRVERHAPGGGFDLRQKSLEGSPRGAKQPRPASGWWDYVIIDTPPALGTLTVNALTACDSVIIPSQADIYSLQGVGQLIQTIQTVQKYCNSKLFIRGFLLVRYSSRAVISRDMTDLLEDTARQLNTKLYKTKIRECVAIKEAQAKHQDIFAYAPKSNAAEDYGNLINEIFGEE